MRIAVCDDEIKDRKIISEALRSTVGECSISEFDNGYELLESHKSLPFDFIILDIIMPRISGIDTAAMLRTTDVHTPVVFVSSSEEFGVQSYRVFAFDYLLKPLDTSTILQSIQKTKNVITMEDGTEVNGLASAVKELIVDNNLQNVEFKSYAYPDKFIQHGTVDELENLYGFNE